MIPVRVDQGKNTRSAADFIKRSHRGLHRMLTTKRDKRWVPSDDERLLKFRDAGLALAIIATTLGRTRTDVEKRLGTFKNQIVNSNQPDVSEAG